MIKTTLIKYSFIALTASVLATIGTNSAAFAKETSTVPIVKVGESSIASSVKDSNTTPIIATPATSDVTARPSGEPTDNTVSITVTVNSAPSTDTALSVDWTHPDAISFPSSVTVPAGSSSVTFVGTITPGNYEHHKNVRISISGNGATVDTKVRVHYVSEQD